MTDFLFFCVDEDGTECVFPDVKPYRSDKGMGCKRFWYHKQTSGMVLPKGSIKHILGSEMSWKNKPIKWKPIN